MNGILLLEKLNKGFLMNRIVQILIERDGMSESEAHKLINYAVEDFNFNEDVNVEDLIAEYFGLEPDYLPDFLEFI